MDFKDQAAITSHNCQDLLLIEDMPSMVDSPTTGADSQVINSTHTDVLHASETESNTVHISTDQPLLL